MSKGPVTQIDYSNLYRVIGLDHDILGLEIRMDDVHTMESGDGL